MTVPARRRRPHPLIILAALLAMVLPVLACSSAATVGAGTSVGPVPAERLRGFYAQELTWTACGRFDCTYLRVPLDYRQPDGKTARLAVLRQRAGQPDQRLGSLVINPGGPGGSGTSAAAGLAQKLEHSPLGQRFDIVGFDPRGIGDSEPAIECLNARERDRERLDSPEAVAPANDPRYAERRDAQYERQAREHAAKCGQRSGTDLLANAGSRDVARDIDVLRSALGEAKLTYLGYSYGTRIGYTYAEAFPHNVRALVLDGAPSPDRNRADELVAQADGSQRAFDAFAGWCAQQAQCPLGGDPKTATATYRKLVLPLVDTPLPLADGRKLSHRDAVSGTLVAFYRRADWEPLRTALSELASGKGESLMRLADGQEGRTALGTYSRLHDALEVVRCVDERPITDPATALRASARYSAAAPFMDSGRGPSAALDSCAFWPVPHTSEAHRPNVNGLPQVLVIAVTGDPATPYQAGVELAAALHARFLPVDGTQHTAALQGTPCVDDIVTRYLTELALPPDGTRCAIAPS